MANPISITLMEKCQEILQTITVANSYEQDVNQVVFHDEIPEELVLPAIVLTTSADRYTDLQGGCQHNELFVTALAYHEGWYDQLRQIHRLQADMHKALQKAFVAAGSWGASRWDGLAVLYRPQTVFYFGDERNTGEFAGVQFDFSVQYRHSELDPYAAP